MPPAPKEVGTRSRGGGGAGFAKGLYPPQGLCVYGYTADYAYTYVRLRLLGLKGDLPSETEALDYVNRLAPTSGAFLFVCFAGLCYTLGRALGNGLQVVC